MTWKQFKEEIERQGVKDATELTFVDVIAGYHPLVRIIPEVLPVPERAFITGGNPVVKEKRA